MSRNLNTEHELTTISREVREHFDKTVFSALDLTKQLSRESCISYLKTSDNGMSLERAGSWQHTSVSGDTHCDFEVHKVFEKPCIALCLSADVTTEYGDYFRLTTERCFATVLLRRRPEGTQEDQLALGGLVFHTSRSSQENDPVRFFGDDYSTFKILPTQISHDEKSQLEEELKMAVHQVAWRDVLRERQLQLIAEAKAEAFRGSCTSGGAS